MATFYLRTSNYGAKKSAASNASYICGLGKYADKDEVSHIEANNLPDFAKDDPQAFFKTAQEQEKERSARGFVFAIPEEAKDRKKWASEFAKDLCGNAPYLLAVHEKDGNPHAHILMSERTLDLKKSLKKNATKPVDPSKLSEEKFFSRVNGKNRDFSRVDFLDQAKEKYLSHIRQVAPDYTPQNKGEIKIGPNLKFAGETYKEQREQRAQAVQELRDTQREITQLQTKLNTAQTKTTTTPQPEQKKQEQPTGKPQPKTESEKVQLLMMLEQKKLDAQAQLAALPPTANASRVLLQQKIDAANNEILRLKQAKPEQQQKQHQNQQQTHNNYGQQPEQQKQQEQVKNSVNNDKSNREQAQTMDARARESLRKEQQDLRTTKPGDGLNHYEIQRREAMAKETQQQQNATAKAQPTFADGREQSRLYQYTKERAENSPEINNLWQMLNQGGTEFVKHAENVFNKTGGQGLSMAQRLKDTSNTLALQITAAATPSAPANTSAAKTKASADGWKKYRPAPPSPFRK